MSRHPRPSAYLFPQNGFDLALSDIAKLCPIEKLNWPLAAKVGVNVYVKREDRLHPHWGGNKFYKCYHHLLSDHLQLGQLSQQGIPYRRVATFGGPYSNHLLAAAAICAHLGWPFTALVRGERPPVLSPTLQDVLQLGGSIQFLPRSVYKQGSTAVLRQELHEAMGGDVTVVPEGGAGASGSRGIYTWVRSTLSQLSVNGLYMAVGSGGTLAGALAAAEDTQVVGVHVLKGQSSQIESFKHEIVTQAEALRQQMSQPRHLTASMHLETDYHLGGYAKYPLALQDFQRQFELDTQLPCDRVYTSKVFFALAQHLRAGRWQEGSNVLVLHTGGLQGNRQIAQ